MAAWLTVDQADAYMATRYGAELYWATGTEKEAALTTAQNDLVATGLYTFPDDDEATDEMKAAVCEQALFLLRQGVGADMRADLQAQGVTEAGVVQEKWSSHGLPIAARATALLVSLRTGNTNSIPWED